jgi:hypothetical protein
MEFGEFVILASPSGGKIAVRLAEEPQVVP